MVFSKSLDKIEACHVEPFGRLRINSAKHLYDGVRDPSVAGERSLRVT